LAVKPLNKLGILRVPNPDTHSVNYIWEEANITVSLSNFEKNHAGLMADFTAECPIGTDVKSGIRLCLEKLNDRRSITQALQALPTDFKEWDKLIEFAFSDAIHAYKEAKQDEANVLPEAMCPDDILALDIPETPWLVKDLLVSSGVTILASLPKKGKTVVALNIVKAAQDSIQFFERDVPNVPILFLALEDPWARLKRRMQTVGIHGKQSIFVITCDLTKGLDPLIRLDDKYQPRIIFIDTLLAALKIKDENSPDLGIAVQGLSEFAHERERSIFILHHHGKTKRDDPVLDLRGHTSLSGAVDVILGLYPEDSPGQFKLKSASRDGEPLDLDVAYDGNVLKWEIDRNYNEVQALEKDFAMMDLLREMGKVSLDAICSANDKSRTANKRVIDRLIDQGQITKEVTKVGYQTVYVYGVIG